MTEMKAQPVAIFDFDGTLVDSKEGILSCLRTTLQRRGLAWNEPLDWFVGPPAHVSLPQLLPSATPEERSEILTEYRSLYAEGGWKRSEPFPGVRAMLTSLLREEWRCFICTAKREDFTRQILEYFDLEVYFEAVYADSGDVTTHSKADLLDRLLRENHISTDAIMIGDRIFDLEAGKFCELRTIAVTYGYGSIAELQRGGPWQICDSPDEVLHILNRIARQARV